jgi:sugar lactone lactonase YvrE
MYGFGPTNDEQLRLPSSVAIAPNGDVYATDPMRARIMIFRADGTFRRLLHTGAGGTEEGQFIRPESIDIDENGDVYIADSWADKIIVFDSEGSYSREWPVQDQARGVHVSDDKVFVLDAGRVLVFDTQGRELAAFGTRGPGPGQIDAYQGVVQSNGVIYVAESFNKRLQAFEESGNVLWTVPDGSAPRPGPRASTTRTPSASASDAVPDHRWDLPQDLTVDARNRLVVVDAFQFQIVVVDPKTGKALARYGEYGPEEGQFFYPTSIDYDPVRDWFAVADTNNGRIQIVRIPDSANPGAATAWRAVSSPFRYLAIPGLLLFVALGLGAWSARKLWGRADSAEEVEDESLSD